VLREAIVVVNVEVEVEVVVAEVVKVFEAAGI